MINLKLAQKIRKRDYAREYYHRTKREDLKNKVRVPIAGTLEEKKRVLLTKITVDEKSGCWKWQHLKDKAGYGKTRWNKKMHLAHRVFYQLFVGDILENKQINHKCHCRSCVNPEHLYTGTQTENMRDMMKANRKVYKKGFRGKNAKFSDEEVEGIINRYLSGERVSHISDSFKVKTEAIYNILRGKTYRYLNLPRPLNKTPNYGVK